MCLKKVGLAIEEEELQQLNIELSRLNSKYELLIDSVKEKV